MLNIETQYFSMYYGCPCARFGKDGKRDTDSTMTGSIIAMVEKSSDRFYQYKLLLRPLSDLNQVEILELTRLHILPEELASDKPIKRTFLNISDPDLDRAVRYDPRTEKYWNSQQILYLREIGIDIYDLQAKGFAIYEKLKKVG